MNFRDLKEKYHALSSQFVVALESGEILHSDEMLLPVKDLGHITEIHHVVESMWEHLQDLALGKELFFPCITALIHGKSRYCDFAFQRIEEDSKRLFSLTIMDLTPQYEEIQKVVQEKNQSNILNELLRTRARTEALEKELLNKQKEQLERVQELKNEFLATMTHEIRTPLNAILGLTHILLDEDPRTDQVDALETVKFSGENLLGLISDILDFSKIEANKIELEKVTFELEKLGESIIQANRVKGEAKGLKVLTSFDNVPPYVIGDPVRISQVLNNLLSNAVKFTDKGEVKLAIKTLATTETDATICLTISDTGIGIPYDRQKDVFEKFTQAEVSTTRHYGGTGLGLAITKQLVDLMGSKIELESHPNEGTAFQFTITLPLGIAPENRQKETHKEDLMALGLKILVVEDNAVNQLVARKILQKWNIDVHLADNGHLAIEKMKSDTFDLVLMDLLMPEMDGYQTTRLIRDELGDKTPIIALTASSTTSVRTASEEAGMNGFISKPFKPEVLQKIILESIQES